MQLCSYAVMQYAVYICKNSEVGSLHLQVPLEGGKEMD